MWILERKSDGKTIHLLNKEYTVGRKNCTIELSDDPSVSRKHLKLLVDYSPLNQDSDMSSLKIMDLGSTYGVFINPSSSNPGKIQPETWVSLKIDYSIHFGIQNEWIVKWKNIIVICSAVGSQARKKLNVELIKLGAKLIMNWQDDITHLVTEKIMLTQKVLDSLLEVKPIVEEAYFASWTAILEKNPFSPSPDVLKFIPMIGQETLAQFNRETFLPNDVRQRLFAGQTFFFTDSKEIKSSMAAAVEKAGGKVSSRIEEFSFNKSVLIETNLPSPSEEYVKLLKSLTIRQERSVPEKEIGLAILACSTERFCNPRYPRETKVDQKDLISHQTNLAFVDLTIRTENPVLTDQCTSSREGNEPLSKRIKTTVSSNDLKQVKDKRSRSELSEGEDMEQLQPPQKKFNTDRKSVTDSFRPRSVEVEQVFKFPKSPSSSITPKCLLSNSFEMTQKLGSSRMIGHDASKWIQKSESPVKSMDRTTVKTRLMRSENGSQKTHHNFKASTMTPRISVMKIACFKDGKWSTRS